MARRKTLVIGSGGSDWLDEYLGYPNVASWRQYLSDYIIKLDYDKIGARCGVKLKEPHREAISEALAFFGNAWIARAMAEDEAYDGRIEPLHRVPMAESEFSRVVKRIESLSVDLENALDSLGFMDSYLLLRPHGQKDDESDRLSDVIDRAVGSAPMSFQPTEDDFLEYLSFRRQLGYYRKFSECNERFNNWYSHRYERYEDRTDQERFVRWVLAGLHRTDFPMGIAIPTETNPDYESPVIALLNEVCEMVGKKFGEEIDTGRVEWRKLSYRQMAYLARENLNDFERISDSIARAVWSEGR